MLDKINLAVEGLPNYDLYADGRIINLTTGKVLIPGSRCGRNLQLWRNNKPKNVNLSILYRRYFDNELMHIPAEYVVNLSFLGFPNYSVTYFGKVWTHRTEQWMINTLSRNGYLRLSLQDINGKSKSVRVHVLVAKAFVPNPFNYDQIDHIDGNKENNIASNLEWVSGIENMRRARLNGLRPMAITDDEIELACQMIVAGKSDSEIAATVGTSGALINAIRHGRIHCQISSKYGIKENYIRGRKVDWSKYRKDSSKYKSYTPKISTLI